MNFHILFYTFLRQAVSTNEGRHILLYKNCFAFWSCFGENSSKTQNKMKQ